MKFEAFHIVQNGHDLYLTHLSAKELLAIALVPRYDPDTGEGYQRLPKEGRIEGVAKYLLEEKAAIFPTAILLNSRKPLRITKSAGAAVTVTVEGGAKLYVVDGQTRMLGLEHLVKVLRKNQFANFPLPIVVCNLESEIEELVNFRVINREAKSVPTGLTDRLIAKQLHAAMEEGTDLGEIRRLFDKKFYATFQAVRVADALGRKTGSPWKGKIKIPNVDGQPSGVSERSFTSSLRPALTTMGEIHDSEMAKRLTAFWQAIYDRCSEAAADPKRYPYLRKPVAAYIGHRIYAATYPRMTGYSKKDFVRELRQIPALRNKLWIAEGDLKGIAGLSSYDDVVARLLSSRRTSKR